jgi:xylose isomerase
MSYFKDIPKIKFEGPKSTNPLAFKHYNPSQKIEGKTMAEHLRFSVVYWHTGCGHVRCADGHPPVG